MKTITGFVYYPDSLVEHEGTTYFLARSEGTGVKALGVTGDASGFYGGEEAAGGGPAGARLFPLTAENAAALRERLPWLRPQPLGLRASAGFGDRLGLATPGHVRALNALPAGSDAIAPIFAQQSVRENARTHRTPQQVMDDAMWGVFQSGWRRPWGADADHLKTTADVDAFHAAGFTFFTIDPGDHVDNAAQQDSLAALRQKAAALPWDPLNTTLDETIRRYQGRTFQVEDFSITIDETTLLRALAKYGRAILHAAQMAAHLAERAGNQAGWELEVSVDETAIPTSMEEHFLIASELRRLGVAWISLAPRFVGSFEKGVDYIGDLAEFEASFARHAAVARYFGAYRLSLHSGSDKFSIYPIAARLTRGLVHLKTAGTSYLEALRVAAQLDPELFRQILRLAIQRYETDRASYHVSASLAKVPDPAQTPDEALPGLLDQFDARQVFHVTFGAALEQYGEALMGILRAGEDAYYQALAAHFRRHLEPLLVGQAR